MVYKADVNVFAFNCCVGSIYLKMSNCPVFEESSHDPTK